MLQHVSRTFALTIPELPDPLRIAVGNAYLWCRIADTVEDAETLDISFKREAFDALMAVLQGGGDPESFGASIAPRLSGQCTAEEEDLVRNTARVCRILRALPWDQQAAILRCVAIMAEGMERFQDQQGEGGLKDLRDLDAYCYCVAGVVGEMLTDLFCSYSQEIAARRSELNALAVSFGEGLQLTNILKDVWDDKGRAVCWLPEEVFAAHGFDLKDLARHEPDECFGEAMQSMVGVAREHLENALQYVTLIPRHETGIRRFCLYAIGMAILTLRNIHRNPSFSDAEAVKINRRTVYGVVGVTRAICKSNFLLRRMFQATTLGLPRTRASAGATGA
jgi:farnesyl-diphosphate farnesyltransferase